MKTKKLIKRIIVKNLYYIAKVTSYKAFWFITGISCHLLAFMLSEIKTLDLNMLLEAVVVYIICFELMYYVFLKKVIEGLKKSKYDFKEILDRWDKEKGI